MNRTTHRLTPYLFLAPAALILLVFFFIPVAYTVFLSFTRYNAIGAPVFTGLANYRRLWADPYFWQTLWNSVLYLLGVVPPLVVLPIGLAILVNRPLPGVSAFRAAYYLPVVISMVVVGVAWKWLYQENGLLNYLLWAMGGPEDGVGWLTDPRVALWAVMAVTVWKGLGYYMVVYLASLQAIPSDLYEAGAMDGASTWQLHRHITLPLLRPAMGLVAIVSSISALKVFTEIYVMTGGGPLNSSKTLVFYLYEHAFEHLNMGYAAALGMVLFLIIFGLTLLNLRLGNAGEGRLS